ncbi:MAG: HAMP domain-containing protein [Chloroflexi bacterium]|nr:HAMP domain-containing protein [Chloroflexota bacterium]
MPLQVLIVQSDEGASQALEKLVVSRGDQVWRVSTAVEAVPILEQVQPSLVLIDLHMPGNDWLNLVRQVRQKLPETKIIVTNKYPDIQRELMAREQGVNVFLREPFTQHWLEKAISRASQPAQVEKAAPEPAAEKPHVRVPVRLKITLPYMILAMIVALAGAYLVSQVILESIQDRFNSQLVETGKQNADWMVQEENRLLETLRLLANTQGISSLMGGGSAEQLRQTILPLVINSKEEAVEILDPQGVSLLSLRHAANGNAEDYASSKGEAVYGDWDFVRYVLNRGIDQGQDKNAGWVRAPWGNFFYVSGPVLNPDGSLAGVVLVGESLETLTRKMHDDTLADATLYDTGGQVLASSLSPEIDALTPLSKKDVTGVLSGQDQDSPVRSLTLASNQYGEILGPWEVRGGTDQGVIGTALAQVMLIRTSLITRTQIILLVAVVFLLVILVGVTLANQITRPLLRVVRASAEVARGNLEVKVDSKGNDEVAILAHTFNSMVAGLQEGSIYRDLLGRTVSPEVREQLRQTFNSGTLRLEGQEAIATVLFSDIRGFTNLAEKVDPATVFKWLNEYYGELVPIVTANTGVINKFDGDAILAFFGILPRPLDTQQSAYSACRAAVEILAAIERLNIQRVERGEPPLTTGIGISTGVVTAGGLGTSDRLHYTIIGDTVNTSQRLEALTRQLFNTTGVVITQSTFLALGEYRTQFRLDPLGIHLVRGKTEQLQLYRLLPLAETMTAEREAVL